MLANPEIVRLIKKYRYAMPFLNYNQRMVASYTDIWRKKMVELSDEMTGGMKWEQKKIEYDFMVFISNKKYYDKITGELGCSHEVIRRLLFAFVDAGLYGNFGLIKPGKFRIGTLHGIGWYLDRGEGYRPKPLSFVTSKRKDQLIEALYRLNVAKS